ncbi:winged helix-turn-helix transcriptional regulator [Candidatus Woesearchaeota archaeon]|nr:winged helix-turn-helix transcriptional regulator [Candidatus Woesearchaeota archaeon]
MNNKKLGIVILSIGVITLILLVNLIGKYNQAIIDEGCFPSEDCKKIESSLSISHLAFGVMGFVISLGFYLLFFSKSEEALLKSLNEEKQTRNKEDRFSILLKALDPFEQRILKVIKEQDGITQNTLRIKADLSKAKTSYVVNDLEDKGLIKRIKKGKTFSVYLRGNI